MAVLSVTVLFIGLALMIPGKAQAADYGYGHSNGGYSYGGGSYGGGNYSYGHSNPFGSYIGDRYSYNQPSAPIYVSRPVYISQPVYYPQPQPVYIQQPQPIYISQPQPVYIQQPQPIIIQQPQPIYIQQPQPIVISQPTYPVYPSRPVISCSADVSTTYNTRFVTWTANVSGLTGNIGYSWSGTEYSGNVNTSTVYLYYPTYGYKTMNLTVWLNGQVYGSASCGSVNIIDP